MAKCKNTVLNLNDRILLSFLSLLAVFSSFTKWYNLEDVLY